MKSNFLVVLMICISILCHAGTASKDSLAPNINESVQFSKLFAKDTIHVNFSAGAGWSYAIDRIVYKNMWSLPSFNLEVERGFFSIGDFGCVAGGIRTTYKYLHNRNPNGDAYWHNFLLGGTAKLYVRYFNDIRLIPYAGFFGGINAITFHDNSFPNSTLYPTNYNGLFPIVYVFGGLKYQSKSNYGVFAEFAYGLAFANLGVYWNL